MKIIAILSIAIVGCLAQRSPYAGRRPVGYPSIPFSPASPAIVDAVPANAAPANAAAVNVAAANSNGIADRLSDDPAFTASTVPSVTTTRRLPIEALGDAELVAKLSKLPVDQQPFWLLNWQALEDYRANPQSFASHRNWFID